MNELKLDFMGKRLIAGVVSGLMVLVSIIALAINGLSLGLDFTGGTQLEIGFSKPVELGPVRTVLEEQHFNDAVPIYFGAENEVLIRFSGDLNDVARTQLNVKLAELVSGGGDAPVVQTITSQNDLLFQSRIVTSGGEEVAAQQQALFPADYFGKVEHEVERDGSVAFDVEKSVSDAVAKPLTDALTQATGATAELKRNESVGSQVGEELWESAVIGGLLALGVIMVYIALRFQFKFAIGAVVALAHDVIITLGFFSLFHWDFDLTVFAAVLAVIGYSLNDTIVVSDRIRENFRKLRKGLPTEIINISLNQTVVRTIVTSLTTLLVLISLLIFGGEIIHNFALALTIGIVVGTYSSIYIAANVMVLMNISKEDLTIPVKEGADLDGMP